MVIGAQRTISCFKNHWLIFAPNQGHCTSARAANSAPHCFYAMADNPQVDPSNTSKTNLNPGQGQNQRSFRGRGRRGRRPNWRRPGAPDRQENDEKTQATHNSGNNHRGRRGNYYRRRPYGRPHENQRGHPAASNDKAGAPSEELLRADAAADPSPVDDLSAALDDLSLRGPSYSISFLLLGFWFYITCIFFYQKTLLPNFERANIRVLSAWAQ